MTDLRSPESSWREVLRFYGRFGEFPYDEGPPDPRYTSLLLFRRLVVTPLAESEWGRRLWASQSVYWLIISPVPGWHPERFERPRVVVDPQDGWALIRRFAADGTLVGELDRSFEAAGQEIEAALSWLVAQPATPPPKRPRPVDAAPKASVRAPAAPPAEKLWWNRNDWWANLLLVFLLAAAFVVYLLA